MKLLWILIFLIMFGCTNIPKATSIEDYCNAVALETEFYAQQRNRLTILDLNYRIEVGLSRYPPEERKKMMEMVLFAYKHQNIEPKEVRQLAKNKCLIERHSGAWYG